MARITHFFLWIIIKTLMWRSEMMSELVTLNYEINYGNAYVASDTANNQKGSYCGILLDLHKSYEKNGVDPVMIKATKAQYDRVCSPQLQEKLQYLRQWCEGSNCGDENSKKLFNNLCKDIENKKKELKEKLRQERPKPGKLRSNIMPTSDPQRYSPVRPKPGRLRRDIMPTSDPQRYSPVLPPRNKIGNSRKNIFMPKQEPERELINTGRKNVYYDRDSPTYEKGNKISADIAYANFLGRKPGTITGEM